MPENKLDSCSLHIEDTIKAGAGLTDAKVAEYISKRSAEVVKELRNFAVDFDRLDITIFSREIICSDGESLSVFEVYDHFIEMRHAYDVVAASWCDWIETHCTHYIPS